MNEPDLAALWVYLSASPLLGLTATLVAYSVAYMLYERAGLHPLLNPVIVAVALSAQATDAGVNKATKRLFEIAALAVVAALVGGAHPAWRAGARSPALDLREE